MTDRDKETLAKYAEIFKNFKPTNTYMGDGWWEVSLPPVPNFENCKSYQKAAGDGAFIVMVEHRKGRDDISVFPDGRLHLSISHNILLPEGKTQPGRIPTWDELKEARNKFLSLEKNFAIMFPPVELYYNLHATCLHLFEIPVNLAIDPRVAGGV